MLFSESRPELNPSLQEIEKLDQMDSQSVGWWGVGWWQAEAVKQSIKAEVLREENARLRELLGRSMDNAVAYHSKPRDW